MVSLKSEVSQSYPTFCDPVDCSPPGSSVHAKLLQLCLTLCDLVGCSLPDSSIRGIFQARILEWVAISVSRGSSQSRNRIHVSCASCIGRWILYHCTTYSVALEKCGLGIGREEDWEKNTEKRNEVGKCWMLGFRGKGDLSQIFQHHSYSKDSVVLWSQIKQ